MNATLKQEIERLHGQDIIGYCLILSDISCIVLKFINFWVAKCMEIMARSMVIQKYRHSSHKALP